MNNIKEYKNFINILEDRIKYKNNEIYKLNDEIDILKVDDDNYNEKLKKSKIHGILLFFNAGITGVLENELTKEE